MRTGDVLLIQGPNEQIATLREESELLVLDATTDLPHRAPLTHKINVLVMSAGGYTFSDFARIGMPLLIIMWLAYSWVLPAIFGL